MESLKKVALTTILSIASICMMSVYSKATTVKVTTETLNIRKSPSTSAQVIAMVSEGVECELIEEDGDWYKVKYKNYTGYISKEYAKLEGQASNSETTEKNESTSENKENEETTSNKNEQQVPEVNNAETNNSQNEQTQEHVVVYKTFNKNCDVKILPLVHSSNIGSMKAGMQVTFITETSGWSYIEGDSISGWVRSDVLSEGKTATTEKPQEETSEKVAYVNENYVNLRKGASTSNDVIKRLNINSKVTILGEKGDWYQVKSGNDTGYILKEFISNTKTVTTRSTLRDEEKSFDEIVAEYEQKNKEATQKVTTSKVSTTKTQTNTTNKQSTSTSSTKAANKQKVEETKIKGTDIIAYAEQYLGYKYVYGGDGSNETFDCSGFTMYVYKHFGINLPHGATSQYKSGKGTKITKQEDLETGDIVFLTEYETGEGIGHCGIYIGNGSFIHASTTTNTVTISNLSTIYEGRFYAGLRLI